MHGSSVCKKNFLLNTVVPFWVKLFVFMLGENIILQNNYSYYFNDTKVKSMFIIPFKEVNNAVEAYRY